VARQNVPFLSFNRGILSARALARVDLDRTRLSAERMVNFIPSTQGSMSIRPGTKYFGSSLSDTGAAWLEFVASTTDVALLELTHNKMRVWLGDDAHEVALLGRPAVDTILSITDTGWDNDSTGGASAPSRTDLIPTMTSGTTSGVTITDGDHQSSQPGWLVGDNNTATEWDSENLDTGLNWVAIDFGSGNAVKVRSHTIRATHLSGFLSRTPASWELKGSNDGSTWTTEVTVSGQTGWAVSEKRTFFDTGWSDTGANAWRHWKWQGREGKRIEFSELELFGDTGGSATQMSVSGGRMVLNAGSIGAIARAKKRVIVSDTGTEHSLAINIDRGTVTLRVGSTDGDDDYISETTLGTGYHNLAFTPQGDFWVTLQTDALVDRIVGSLEIGDSGTVEITTPWEANDVDNVRYDQSADVVYADCEGVRPSKIERRGTGRSWSVVDYAPDNGPFLPTASSSAKLTPGSLTAGNTTLTSDVPYFTSSHVGALFKIFHESQSGFFRLGALGAKTDVVQVTGIGDTGVDSPQDSERRITVAVTGTWSGRIKIERSLDGDDLGFKEVPGRNVTSGSASDTGTFSVTIDDDDDNIKAWYRARVIAYNSGVAEVFITYFGGGRTGIGRVTAYNSNTSVDIESTTGFSSKGDTGFTNNWQEGYWSEHRGFPTAVALHGGRLGHAQGGSLFLTVSDDFESFDDTTPGDAGPIIRTLGSGPVDNIHYLISLVRMIIGTAGSELMLKSSSLDEPVTPDNSAAVTFSTQGSANLRAVKMDTRAIMVQRSEQRVFMIGPSQGNVVTDYEAFDLTLLVPDLLAAGIVSIAIQRQPDTRLHVVLADGTVGVLTYEPQEEVVCWSTWAGDTGTGAAVEKVAILPGTGEDAVFYHIRRTINGATKRYLEKWAKESECTGDSGLCWLMDSAVSFSDTGRTTAFNGVASHLVGESVVAWGDLDTGSTPYVDLSPDVSGVQTRWSIDTGGDLTLTGLTDGVHHGVLGLPYRATWTSTKLAYAAEAGTALAQMKRTDKVGVLVYRQHQNGLFLGNDTGNLDPLPRMYEGASVDPDYIYQAADLLAMPVPNRWATDPRLTVVAKSPRPATVLALVPSVATNERV
jgi:hypothetical protein